MVYGWCMGGGRWCMGKGISFKCNMLADGKYACLWVVCLHKGWYMGGTDMQHNAFVVSNS